MLMTGTETVFRHAPASAISRAALVGWLAWSLFILAAGAVSTIALLDRYRGYCAGPGEAGRDWAFELFPFAQTCVVTGVATTNAPMASFQTAVVYLLLLVALTSTILNLIRSGIRNLPRLALSLVVAQFTGIALAAIVVLIQVMTNEAPPPLNGIDLGLVWKVVLALGVAAAVTAAAFSISALVKLGKTSP